MEELQSTDILEREILEDARKKALRILKTAEDTIKAKTAEWNQKTADVVSSLEKKYYEQMEHETKNVMARLPIDKLRTKIKKTERLLQDAVEHWYNDTGSERILELLSIELSKRLKMCTEIQSEKKKAYFSGMKSQDAQMVLKSAGLNIDIEETIPSHYPLIKIETENTRITASIQEVIDYMLLEKREELIESLVGRDFMANI